MSMKFFPGKNTGEGRSFSRGYSWPRDRTWVSLIVGRFFTIWVTREALITYVFLLSCSVMSNSLRPPWNVACQALPSVGFSRQEYWSGLLFPPPGNFPESGIEHRSPALQVDFYHLSYKGSSTSKQNKKFKVWEKNRKCL